MSIIQYPILGQQKQNHRPAQKLPLIFVGFANKKAALQAADFMLFRHGADAPGRAEVQAALGQGQ